MANELNTGIGNDVIMPSTAALYLLHLPKDVLAYVPLQGIENSPLGNAPRGGGPFENFFIGVANFIWNGIVSVARFILDLGVGDVVGKCVRYYVDLCAPDPLINHAYVVGYFERCCCHMPAVEVRDSARASVCIIGCGGFGSLSSDSGFCSNSIMMSTRET